MQIVSNACAANGRLRGPAQADTAQITAGMTKVLSAALKAGATAAALPPRCRHVVTSSISAATVARMSSSHTVPGTLPV